MLTILQEDFAYAKHDNVQNSLNKSSQDLFSISHSDHNEDKSVSSSPHTEMLIENTTK